MRHRRHRAIFSSISDLNAPSTAGLYEIKRHGGITIVQDPSDAICPAMPASALKHVAVDHCVPLTAMPRILFQICKDIAADSKELSRAAETGGPSHA